MEACAGVWPQFPDLQMASVKLDRVQDAAASVHPAQFGRLWLWSMYWRCRAAPRLPGRPVLRRGGHGRISGLRRIGGLAVEDLGNTARPRRLTHACTGVIICTRPALRLALRPGRWGMRCRACPGRARRWRWCTSASGHPAQPGARVARSGGGGVRIRPAPPAVRGSMTGAQELVHEVALVGAHALVAATMLLRWTFGLFRAELARHLAQAGCGSLEGGRVLAQQAFHLRRPLLPQSWRCSGSADASSLMAAHGPPDVWTASAAGSAQPPACPLPARFRAVAFLPLGSDSPRQLGLAVPLRAG